MEDKDIINNKNKTNNCPTYEISSKQSNNQTKNTSIPVKPKEIKKK